MTKPPLLDDEGRPLPLFGFLNSHDAFRRDLPRFAGAAARIGRGELDGDALDALRYHWSAYRTFLEAHHTTEDENLFTTVVAREPGLKALIEDLAAQHDELHELLHEITALLADAGPSAATALERAFASLAGLLVPHFAAEEENLVPVLRAAIAAGPGGPPPGRQEAEEPLVPDDYGVPFTTEHLADDLRAVVLPLFPSQPDPASVDAWLADYRSKVARWAG